MRWLRFTGANGHRDPNVAVGAGSRRARQVRLRFKVPARPSGRRPAAFLIATILVLLPAAQSRAMVQRAPGAAGNVIANLWEWNWPSIGRECTTVLGPAGYGGVQVAPPEDSYAIPTHEWYDVYQPIDYNLTGRMGSEAQFKDMVTTCRAAGVKVYVDAVINHMTGGGGTSYGGVTATKYDYPGLYSANDFHHTPADCPEPDGTIHDFNDPRELTECELLGLADLRTESEYVRTTIAGYLNGLIDDGVSGFRVDAAKHISQADLGAIEAKLHPTLDGGPPYMALEVMPGSPGTGAPEAYEPLGNLLGFDYATQIRNAFIGRIAGLRTLGQGSGSLPSDKVLVFVENHDTERNGSTLSYQAGKTNVIATEFMLAWPYGTPQVYASFQFSDPNQAPPSNGNGLITDTNCAGAWACTDRKSDVIHMVAWHNGVAGTAVAHWYSDHNNLIAFSRGTKGWIAINNGARAVTKTFSTGLPKGKYCDIIHGTFTAGTCSGRTVKVDAHHKAKVKVSAKDAVAFAADNRIG